MRENTYYVHIGLNDQLRGRTHGQDETLCSFETILFKEYSNSVFSYADPGEGLQPAWGTRSTRNVRHPVMKARPQDSCFTWTASARARRCIPSSIASSPAFEKLSRTVRSPPPSV